MMNKNNYKKIIYHYIGHGEGVLNSIQKHPNIVTENGLLNIVQEIENTKFKNITIVLDCCNGLPHGVPRMQKMNYPGINLILNLTGFNIICSSRKSSLSYYIENRHTLFFAAYESMLSNSHQTIQDALYFLDTVLKKLLFSK